MKNDRGIFAFSVIRNILDKLIYDDKYEEIDKNMSESNIGGRKERNIRNHLFILNGILNSVRQKESNPIDIQLYDIQQAFDSMWVDETMNDMFEVCEPDDKLSLIYECNKESYIKINTPFGQTESAKVEDVEAQGSVLSPIRCSIQIDSLGKECIDSNENVYKYKNLLNIPPLYMIDDIVGIAECGHKSVKMNCFLNTKIEMKKLWMNKEKCHQIHVGAKKEMCPELIIHDSKMPKVSFDKYLGEMVSDDCLNKKDIELRVSKGMSYISQIMIILEEVCFGQFYFDTAVLLRESIFINGILSSIEANYGLNVDDIEKLEVLDRILLRKILSAHSKSPSESLYLELGLIPVKFIIIARRLNFLHYILNRPDKDLLGQFFKIQNKYPTKNYWVTIVKEDLKLLNITEQFDEIKKNKKCTFSKMVKKKIVDISFKFLVESKLEHSKMDNLNYTNLEMQSYFKTGEISTKEAKTVFKYRTRMAQVKANFSSQYLDLYCPECSLDLDTQKHLLEHTEQQNNAYIYEKLFTNGDYQDKRNLVRIMEDVLSKR